MAIGRGLIGLGLVASCVLSVWGCSEEIDPDRPSDADIEACRDVCLQFGPEDCTRECYAACETTCGFGAADDTDEEYIGMSCSGGNLNIFTKGGGTRGCSTDGTLFEGKLPSGTWKTAKRMFVTSQYFTGEEIRSAGGEADALASADRICNQLAEAAGLDGTFVAWLSTTSVDAVDRIQDVSPWFSATRSEIHFDTAAALRASPTSWYRVQTEEGGVVTGEVWTGTGQTGLHLAPEIVPGDPTNCGNWTGPGYGVQGSPSIGSSWTEFITYADCETDVGAIYCFEQ